jgi:hypothetical protein
VTCDIDVELVLYGAVLVGEDGPVSALVLLLGLLDAHDDSRPIRPELAARLCRQVFRHLHRTMYISNESNERERDRQIDRRTDRQIDKRTDI